MGYSVATYFLYFIILAILGWIMEITVQLIEKHKFSDRGFLIGPYCPIYGCGGILITLLLTALKEHPIALFSTAILICGILEYITSYLMEKIFHARWWDYTKNKFNINGRVCLETIIPFGLLGLALIYGINPFIFNILTKIPNDVSNIVAIIIAILFALDIGISFKVISNVRSIGKKIDLDNPKDNTEEISKKVKEFLRSKSFLNRRLTNAFPDFKSTWKEQKEKIKQKTKQVKEEIANKANEIKEEIAEKASEVREEFNDKANEMKENIKQGIDKTSKKVKKIIEDNSKKD